MANIFDQFDQDVAKQTLGGNVQGLPNHIPAGNNGASHSTLMEDAGARFGIPQGLMTALMGQETGGTADPTRAVSSKGAFGMGQVMPDTARGMGYTDEQMLDPANQAEASARYLSQMYNRYGNWRDALQAYHDGPGNHDKYLKGEYQQGPEGSGYVNARFAPWIDGNDPGSVGNATPAAASTGNVFDQFGDYTPPQQQAQQEAPQQPQQQQATQQQPGATLTPEQAIEQQIAQRNAQQQQHDANQPRNMTVPEILEQSGRGLAKTAENILNIPIDVANMTLSGVTGLAGKVGIGDGTYTPIPRGSIGIDGPTDPYAQLGADIGSFLAPVPGAAKVKAAEELAAKIGQAAPEVGNALQRLGGFFENRVAAPAVRATPGAVASAEGDPDKVALGIAAGPIGEGALSLAAKGAQAAAPALKKAASVIPGISRGESSQAAGQAAGQAAETVNSAAQDVGTAARAAQKSGAATTTVDDITAPTAAVELAKRGDVDTDLVKAANDLGITDDLTPGLFMRNKSVRDVLANIRSKDGSASQEAFGKQYRALQDQAAGILDNMGGKVDDMTFDSTFNNASKAVVDRLGAAKEKAYTESLKQIPASTPVNVDNSLNHLWQRADDVGQQWMLPLEKEALERLQPDPTKAGGATFNRLDDLRRKVGDAMSNYQTGSNERRLLGQLYSRLTDDQGQVAANFGVSDRWQQAKRLNQLWVAAQTRMRAAIGKDIDNPKSVSNTIYSETRKLGTPGADPKGFKEMMDRTPRSLRGDVATQALAAAFKGGDRTGNALDVAGFARWHNEASNSGKLAQLTKYLPDDVNQRLSNFAKITAAARKEAEGFKATGKISDLDNRLGGNSSKTLDRIFNTRLGNIALQGVASTIPGGVGNVAAEVARQSYAGRRSAVEITDKFISSGALNQAVKILARNGDEAAASRILESSSAGKSFVGSLTPSQKAAVSRVGLATWLTTPMSAVASENNDPDISVGGR